MNQQIAWRKSSRSADNAGQCIEVGLSCTSVKIRDSTLAAQPDFPSLTIPADHWADILAHIKTGDLSI